MSWIMLTQGKWEVLTQKDWVEHQRYPSLILLITEEEVRNSSLDFSNEIPLMITMHTFFIFVLEQLTQQLSEHIYDEDLK